jgi:hypothetical protein
MPFAIAISLVVLISSVVLVYQFWMESLVEERGGDVTALDRGDVRGDERRASPAMRIDTAA